MIFFFLIVYLSEYLQSVLGGTISKMFSIKWKGQWKKWKELHIRSTWLYL